MKFYAGYITFARRYDEGKPPTEIQRRGRGERKGRRKDAPQKGRKPQRKITKGGVDLTSRRSRSRTLTTPRLSF